MEYIKTIHEFLERAYKILQQGDTAIYEDFLHKYDAFELWGS